VTQSRSFQRREVMAVFKRVTRGCCCL